MVSKTDFISSSYLDFNMIRILGITLIFTHLAAGDLFLYDDRFQPALGLSNDITLQRSSLKMIPLNLQQQIQSLL